MLTPRTMAAAPETPIVATRTRGGPDGSPEEPQPVAINAAIATSATDPRGKLMCPAYRYLRQDSIDLHLSIKRAYAPPGETLSQLLVTGLRTGAVGPAHGLGRAG
ncbi:hypothetical protein Acy02nite_03200 [Actinoplanes cyaneus]|uniref:Uncharacterized protein n=1 Tax=Actinoplanes cyaneus TaxID=52696 RepID=A0A919IB07_9ACTN|nr:hypothetical protein Acy02nite_03200 [Actinoplanes cyaneus]